MLNDQVDRAPDDLARRPDHVAVSGAGCRAVASEGVALAALFRDAAAARRAEPGEVVLDAIAGASAIPTRGSETHARFRAPATARSAGIPPAALAAR
jgi:hypothetical protein